MEKTGDMGLREGGKGIMACLFAPLDSMLYGLPPERRFTEDQLRLSWPRQWVARIRHDFWLKTFGITAFIWLFFVAYFWLLRNPQAPVTVMPLLAVDRWIGFQPWCLWPYLTLWVYVTFAPTLIADRGRLIRYGVAAAALCLTGLAIFWIWPTAVPDGLSSWEAHAGFRFLKGIDASGNALPSLHVATAVFSAIWLDRLLAEMHGGTTVRIASGAWAAAIVYSTMGTKQHVFLDALTGALLGIAAAALSRPFVDRKRRPPSSR